MEKELHHTPRVDGSLETHRMQAPVLRQGADRGQVLSLAGSNQAGSLSPRCPRPNHTGKQTKACFVDPGNQASFLVCPLFTSAPPCRKASTRAGSCSALCVSGF